MPKKLSAVDQRLASALHKRQIEAIVRCESIGDAVDSVFDRAVSSFLAIVTSEGGEPFGKARHAGRILASAFQEARSTIDDQFRRMAYWGWGETAKAVAENVPRNWLRKAQPALALIPTQEGIFEQEEENEFLTWLEKGAEEEDARNKPTTEAERRSRRSRSRRDSSASDITQPNQVGRFRRRGGGPPGGRRRTANATGEPDDRPKSMQVTIPGQTLGNPADGPIIQGGDIQADIFTEPLARGGRVSDDEWEKIVKQVVIPPPTPAQVEAIIQGQPINGKMWQERFSDLSRKITNPEALAAQLITGYSQGENLQQLTKRITPLVQGIKSSARRIARTEGMRVAETIQRDAWKDLGDMMQGVQILAVLDQNTRQTHAARNGTIFYNEPKAGQKPISELPHTPDEPNCRCWTTPVLKPPAEFENNPAVKQSFANDEGLGIPDPSVYSEWFQKVDAGRRKMAVGVKRYNAMAATLGDSRQPEWTDFIDADGNLLDPRLLANESPLDRAARKQEVQKALDERKRLIHNIARQGFVSAK